MPCRKFLPLSNRVAPTSPTFSTTSAGNPWNQVLTVSHFSIRPSYMPCRKFLPLSNSAVGADDSALTKAAGMPATNVTASVSFVEIPSLMDVKNPTTLPTMSPMPLMVVLMVETTVDTVLLIAFHTVEKVSFSALKIVVTAAFMVWNWSPTWSTIQSTADSTTSDIASHTVENCLCMICSAREMSSHASAIHGATVFAIQSATGLMTA